MAKKKKHEIVTRLGRHLYRVKYKREDGQWSVYHRARLRDWQGVDRIARLSDDLATARRELRALESHNIHCRMTGEAFDAGEQKAKAAKQEAEQREQEAKHRLTVKAWLPLCRKLPEMRLVNKRGKLRGRPRSDATLRSDAIYHGHLTRLLGDVYLDRLTESDLTGYGSQRAKEFIVRGGRAVRGRPVQQGTVRNELASLSMSHRLGREWGERYRESCLDNDNRDREVKRLVQSSGLPEKVLAALQRVATGTNPKFAAIKPEAGKRDRILSPAEEQAYFKAAFNDKIAPPWFARIAMLANLTALDESSLLALTEDQIDREAGEFRVTRQKTGELHTPPAMPEALAVIDAQLRENSQEKIRRAVRKGERLIFVRDDGQAWTRSSVQYRHRDVCRVAKISGFWFRDFRHQAASRWAREMKDLTGPLWNKAMGHGQGSNQMATYVNLKAGSVGAAFKKRS